MYFQIKGRQVRLINLHLPAASTSVEQNREIRTVHAEKVCEKATAGKKWKWVIIGMDMNDLPGGNNSVYQTFMNCGFKDAYNPSQK